MRLRCGGIDTPLLDEVPVNLGLREVKASARSNYIPNIRQRVTNMIDTYVGDSEVMRNKIAHGGWIEALNSGHTAVNPEISKMIADLDAVQLGKVKRGWEALCTIIESLIESPDRSLHRDYWPIVAQSEAVLERMEFWTLESKIKLIQAKQIPLIRTDPKWKPRIRK